MSPRLPVLGRAERHALLLLSRLELGPEQLALARDLVRGPLDWAAVLFYARLHSTAPLVHRQIDRLGAWAALPREARQALLRLVHATEYRNRIFSRENNRLVTRLAEAGIPVVIPKGLTLHARIYGSLALRPLIDLIFLVPPDRVNRASTLLVSHGYRRQAWRPGDGIYRWVCPHLYFEADRHLRLVVLLLWDLMTWSRLHRIDMAGLWRRAEPATLEGVKALTLSPEDLVIYLCLQADNHGYLNGAALETLSAEDLLFAGWSNNRLIRFVDLYEVIRADAARLDWRRLAERAQAGGVAESVRTSLALTNQLVGAVVADEVLRSLPSPNARGIRRWVLEALVPEQRRGRGPRLKAAFGRWHQGLRPFWQIRTARLVSLVDYALPEPRRLQAHHGLGSRAAVALVYLTHVSHVLLRSLWTPLWLGIGRLASRAKRLPVVRIGDGRASR